MPSPARPRPAAARSQRRSSPPARAVLRATALAGAAVLLGLSAQAQTVLTPTPRTDFTDADTLQLRAGLRWEHDDNVFKAPAAQAQSDQLLVSSVGLRVSKPWSLQRLDLNLSVDRFDYDRNSTLDFTALNYEGAFRWAVTPRLRGNVLADRREYVDRFSAFSATGTVNRRTELSHALEAEYEVGAAWRALAGVFEQQLNNSLSSQFADTTVRGGELGARYDFRSGNSLAYRLRQGTGDYAGASTLFPATGFTDRQHDFELNWAPTGQLRVNGRMGHLDRQHDNDPARNFSGWVGRLNATWNLTGKTSVTAGVIRDLAAFRTDFAGYYQGHRAFIEPRWQATAKTAVRLRLEQGQRDYRAPIVPTATDVGRQDKLSVAAIALEWEPIRAVRLMLTAQRDERSSNIAGRDYRGNLYAASFVWWF